MRSYDDHYKVVTNALKNQGLAAAVRVVTRIYEETDSTNPWPAFHMSSSVAAVHIARWTLGHDKNGSNRFEPKRVTDPRFKKIVQSHLPPGESVERLVMAVAIEHIPVLIKILQQEEERSSVVHSHIAEVRAIEEQQLEKF